MKPLLSIFSLLMLSSMTQLSAVDLTHLSHHQTQEAPMLTENDFVVVDFVAPWCRSCLTKSPVLEKQVAEFERADVKFLAVNIDQSNPKLTKRFLDRSGLNTLWQDADGELYQTLSDNAGVPFIVLFKIQERPNHAMPVAQWVGHVDASQILNAIQSHE